MSFPRVRESLKDFPDPRVPVGGTERANYLLEAR
jgi:hypothetical protein